MRALKVVLYNEIVGRVEENRKGGRFSYTPEIAAQFQGAPVLSLALPAKRRSFGESRTYNWFNNLLPEGRRRDDVCRRLGIGRYDWIGLLAQIGWECAGAVRIFSEEEAPSHPAAFIELSESELARSLSAASTRQPRNANDFFRMSLDGFQEKICLAMPQFARESGYVDTEGALQPIGDAASTHILKPENPQQYPGSAESEAWAMIAAGHAARCANVALLCLNGAPDAIVVERFDRVGKAWPRGVARLHQEDACQALGLPPDRKYAASHSPKGDDPTYAAIAMLLSKYASDPEPEIDELFRQLVVNMAMGNWDAHAKNIAFLFTDRMLPTVAPLYDVVPIAEVEQRTTQLSLHIAGSLDPSAVSRRSLIVEANNWGIDCSRAERLIDNCLANLEIGVKKANELYPRAAKRHAAPTRKRMQTLG